ncbi:MAG: GNAT family N-acetyltransferase [Pseudohongiellaceae bacterium]|nr:GNAT family N-acetyltransferase [Pseudohongiellaceae bacterium]
MTPKQTIHLSKLNDTASVSAIYALIQNTISQSYSPVYPSRAVEYFQRMYSAEKILANSSEGLTLMAKLGDTVVGTGTAINDEISGVFVSNSHQGCGIGSKIMKRLELSIAQAGKSSVSLSVSLPAVKFYKGLGYEGFEEMSIDVGEGQTLDYWMATKSI